MFEEITSIYEIHRWARYTMWTILLIMALFLIWFSGGIPPLAWRQLPSTIQQLPRAWTMHGPGAWFSLLGLALISLGWLLAWCLLLGGCFALLIYHWHWQQREREMAKQLSTNGTLPLLRVLPIHAKSRPTRKIIPMPLAGPMENATSDNQHTYNHDDDGEYEEDSSPYTAPIPVLRLPQQPRRAPHLTTKHERGRQAPSTPTSPRLTNTPTTLPISSHPARSLEVGVGWHVGKVRRGSPNEDSLFAMQGISTCKDQLMPFGLLIVADGMGGHAYGREASHIAIQTVTNAVMQDMLSGDTRAEGPDDTWFTSMLIRGIEQANQAICAFSEKVEKGKETEMGTTITAALIINTTAYVVNVGDSRTYLYREGEGLSQITKDHSLVARLVEIEQIEPDDVYTHPQRNQIYRCVGNRGGIDVDWFIVTVRRGDRLLLCSDGLWEMVRDAMIEQIMGSKATVAVVSERLVRAALQGGGTDNISVVVAEVA